MEQAGHTHIRHRHGAGRGYVSVRIGIALNRFISVHRYLVGSGTGVFPPGHPTPRYGEMPVDGSCHPPHGQRHLYVPIRRTGSSHGVTPWTNRTSPHHTCLLYTSYISCNGKSFRAYTMWESSSAAKALIPLGQIASGIYTQEYEQQDGEAPQG